MNDELLVVYGDTEIRVPASTELDTLKAAMIENFPELKNATVQVEDDRVTFSAVAGTKGQ